MKKQMKIHWNTEPYIYHIKVNRKVNLYPTMKRLRKIKRIGIVGRGLMIIYGWIIINSFIYAVYMNMEDPSL